MNISFADMKKTALGACELLKTLSHPQRLMIACQLASEEKSVGQLSEVLDIRDSSASQHLGQMRREGIVKARRDGQTVWYSLDDPTARALVETLHRLYCDVPRKR